MDDAYASRLQLPPGPWATVLDALCDRFPAVTRAQWQDRMARGLVRDAAGRPLDADARHRTGLELTYRREVADEVPVPFQETVLYQDAHLVVADKPHFLPVTPSGDYLEHTLLRRLQRRLGEPGLVPLHRIDRGTAGLVLFSSDPGSRAAYQALFRERRIEKHYLARAPGLPGRDFPQRRRSRIVAGEPFFRMRETEGEANAETRIEVLARGAGDWLYGLQPVTGRKHQLRVHLAALGAPIRNDPLYPALVDGAEDFSRPLQLLAKRLAFVDPLSGEPRAFESPCEL